MSLSSAAGPLSHEPEGVFNFDLEASAPGARMYFTAYPLRVRAIVAGRTVLDTVRGRLLYESGIPPFLYLPFEDLDRSVLTRTTHRTHCPYKGNASHWSITVDRVTRENAVWVYEAPLAPVAWLRGYASLYHDMVDEWWAENERVLGYLRDPFHRVDAVPSSRRVRVSASGRVIAESDRAVLVLETGRRLRAYLPRADVHATIEPTRTRSLNPYIGEARYWSVGGVADAAWSYERPRPEAAAIEGLLAFDARRVDVEFILP